MALLRPGLPTVQTGNVWATYAWPDAYVALKDKVDVAYIRPSGGTLAWVEGLVLRSDTENYHHAHKYVESFINHDAFLVLLRKIVAIETGVARLTCVWQVDVSELAVGEFFNQTPV